MPDEPRDYLAEAHAIMRGETMLLPQVEHLKALADKLKLAEDLLIMRDMVRAGKQAAV